MKAYLEKVDGEFRNVNHYTAWRGLVDRGYEIEFFHLDDVEALDLSAETPLVAGIGTIWRALRKMGITTTHLEPIPAGLEQFAGRGSGFCELGEVRQRIAGDSGPLFIKPRAAQGKLFAGHVVREFRDLIETAGLPDEMIVWWSDFVPFVGEFRGFVHQNELVGFRHYYGNFRVTVDFAPVEAALQAWENKPIGCSMDWGVTADGKTLLVEVNDGYSLGCYGLAPHLYAPLLADRWRQMVELGTQF